MCSELSRYPAFSRLKMAKDLNGQRKKNGGAALIMALLIVVMVSVLAVTFSESFNLNVARSENRWYGAQAKNYLLAILILPTECN